ncbi:MAG: TRAP transporter substrate-binding protein [Candidatus Methylomirabilia bacterium]
MERRKFLVKAGGTLMAAGAAAAVEAPNVIAQPKYQWRMATSWPPKYPIYQDGAEKFAKRVEVASGGRLKIDVYAAGELIPALGNFDAVRQGTVEVGHAAAYWWAGYEPATQWFTTVPFGMNAQGTLAWLTSGGGQELHEELYSGFNLVPRRGGFTGVQMAGWFRKKIKSVDDLKGLKMRIPGLGGKVYGKVGVAVVMLAPGDIYISLERGVLDATEWIGPYLDRRLGLHQVAKYYYYPGWHEPGTSGELFFNKKAYEKLPVDLQYIIDAASDRVANWMFTQFDVHNASALEDLVVNHKVQVLKLPDSVLADFRKLSAEVVREEAEKSPMAKKVSEAYNKFMKQWLAYSKLSEAAYYDLMFG